MRLLQLHIIIYGISISLHWISYVNCTSIFLVRCSSIISQRILQPDNLGNNCLHITYLYSHYKTHYMHFGCINNYLCKQNNKQQTIIFYSFSLVSLQKHDLWQVTTHITSTNLQYASTRNAWQKHWTIWTNCNIPRLKSYKIYSAISTLVLCNYIDRPRISIGHHSIILR